MNVLGYRLPLVGLIGLGLVGCSAAAESPSEPGPAQQPGLELSVGAASGESDSHQVGDDAGDVDEPLPEQPGMPTGGTPEGGDQGHCDCGIDLPGITINQSGDGIAIIVDLPNDGSIVIETKHGDCTTHEGGLDITGDVTVDLGGDAKVPLLDAKLHVGVGGSLPTIDGTADVDGSLLDGVTGGALGDLHVKVSLDPNVAQSMPESDALAALDLQLELSSAIVGCGCFPAMNGDLALIDASVFARVDGSHKVVEISADVAANAGALWTSLVPLHATAQLTATAMLNDGALTSIAFDGDMASNAGSMWCGLTPLLSIALPNAKLMLDAQGATLSALVQASLHPGYSLSGQAQLSGAFTKQGWSLNLCGGALADLTLVSAKVTACLDLSASGAMSCDKPAPG